MPHIHVLQVLDDINHWQDEKEENYKIQLEKIAKLKAEADKKEQQLKKEKELAAKKAADAKAKRKA